MKNVKYILGFLAFLVAAFFIYDITLNKENPCGQLFETTSASLTTKINLLKKDSALVIGRNRIQALSSSAQQTALSLQSCCIAAHSSVISGEQFLECQAGANTYASRLDEITMRLAELEKQKNTPMVVAANESASDSAIRSLESSALKTNTLQPQVMNSDRVVASKENIAKTTKKNELDVLIDKALSASLNFKKNVEKVVK